MVEEDATTLARLVQGAALDPTGWEPALNAVSKFVGGAGAVLLTVDARQRFAPASTDMAELTEDYFAGGWFKVDRRDPCIPMLRAEGVVFEQDFLPVEDIEHCDYYQDFLRRHGRKWFAGVGASVDGDDWCLALQRTPTLGPFTRSDTTRLHYVRRLLLDAAALSRSVGDAWTLGLQHALSAISEPAIVFDSHARVLFLNDPAALHVGAFVDKDRNLRFAHPRATASFHDMLRDALATLGRLLPRMDRVIDLGGSLFACQATTLLDRESLLASKAAVLVLMKPVAGDLKAAMKRKYKLTDAEVGVALALAEGKSVQEISAENQVRENTIRTQLKSIYAKTEISRQSQLVALVRRLELRSD